MFNKTTILLVLCLSIGIMAQAQDGSKDFKTKSISIFKNGSAFFQKTGKVNTTNRTYRMDKNIPAALFGTLWFNSPSGKLKNISSFNDQVEEKSEIRATSFAQMLTANRGKKLRLHIGKDEIVEGTVEEVEAIKTPQTNPAEIVRIVPVTNLLVFKTADKWITLNVAEIRRIEFLEKPNQILDNSSKLNKPVLQFDFNNNQASQALDLMYLAKGLSWSPNYLIELIDDTKAQLTLRAEVENNLEDIENTEMNFVVGVPNFRYANRLSSLVNFFNTLQVASARDNSNQFSNAIVTQTSTYSIQEDSGFNPIENNGSIGNSQEDLFFYNLKNFSLKKGGRGHYEIFKTKVDVKHIYECSINANNANQRNYQQDFLFTPDNKNKVFHSIRVDNQTDFPWTTGSAMVVKGTKDAKPISQDLLSYTAINGHSFVKLTEAPDVKVQHAEKEIRRQDRVIKNPSNPKYYLDLVVIEGKLKVKNFKGKKISLNLKRSITGKLKDSSIKWLKAERVQRNGQNSITDVCWETELKPGEEIEINYSYQVYVPD